MQSFHYLRGLIIGFMLAAPVGPVGILCIRRALADGRYAAFVAGMGAAFADTFYGAVAGLGITVISSFLLEHGMALRIIGGTFLISMGIVTWRTPAKIVADPSGAGVSGPGLVRDFLSTFLITLSNPGTILGAMGVFAAFGALGNDSPTQAGILIFGVFTGSALWWLLLSAMAAAVRSKLNDRWMTRLNHLSGGALGLAGAGILISLAL